LPSFVFFKKKLVDTKRPEHAIEWRISSSLVIIAFAHEVREQQPSLPPELKIKSDCSKNITKPKKLLERRGEKGGDRDIPEDNTPI
jgi:hypothetical protein